MRRNGAVPFRRCCCSSRLQSEDGDAAGALDSLRKARALAPNSEDVLSAFAQMSLAAGAPVPAVVTLESLTRMCPTSCSTTIFSGSALMRVGDRLNAVDALRAAEQLDPNRALTLLALGIAHNSLQRYADAKPFLAARSNSIPRTPTRWPRSRKPNRASASSRPRRSTCSGCWPRHRNTRRRISSPGWWRWIAAQYAEARAALERAVQTDPLLFKAHYQLSLACARLGDEAAASRHLEQYRQTLRGVQKMIDELRAATGPTGTDAVQTMTRANRWPCSHSRSPRAARPATEASATSPARPASHSSHHAAPEKKFIVESMSGGVALFDYDNDGRLDIYFVDSLTVETAGDPKQARSALYRNLGKLQVRATSPTKPASAILAGAWASAPPTSTATGGRTSTSPALGGNKLYRNNHDGTFSDVTERAGVAGGGWSAGCGFADYDRDGDLDLFVSRYVKMDLKQLPQFGRDKTCQYRGIPVQCGPRGLPGESDFLFRNDGNMRFTEVGAAGRRRRSERSTSVSASPGSITTRTAGRISSSPTIRARTSSTSIRRTARSRTSHFRWASR